MSQRFFGFDLHKNFIVVAAVNANQEVIFRPYKIASADLENWIIKNIVHNDEVVIEAMSCSVPVVGSSSGEIPRVIGAGGLIYPEGDIPALAAALRQLADDPSCGTLLGMRGRARVLEHYTQAALAQRYYAIYLSMLA